ncbi:porphobilinogen deaminase [Rhizoclosmatium globosum]|uniref:hydroxymethylbilane synthase n=1 Tax=Rhizoclosmatium globosum TaxID=329046 RepID=A0A1Y2BFI6_9FUNG|nr:porphobilinogen deaminase [Rhizoclosmatium globosum]|eukprot:ORY33578.1 porphobilinogen deaminase [Rhizoclosmatium globosum]
MEQGPTTQLVIGSRKSQLAMIQTMHVKAVLEKLHPSISFSVTGMTTTGDEVLNIALSKIGSKALFTKELEVALYDKSVDLVVHSLKDMPTQLPEGMIIGAIMEREDPRDAVVMKPDYHAKGMKLQDLPPGSVIGTSSVRRIAQLRRRFPHLEFQDVRGNLNTRLAKLDAPDGPYAALLLAHAGLVRMQWHSRISQTLDPGIIMHAVGQGALGIEIRENDTLLQGVVAALEHKETALRCIAERGFMRGLEGGCSVPLGVWTELVPIDGTASSKFRLILKGSVCSVDGSREIRDELEGQVDLNDMVRSKQLAEKLGRDLSVKFIADGAQDILREIRK